MLVRMLNLFLLLLRVHWFQSTSLSGQCIQPECNPVLKRLGAVFLLPVNVMLVHAIDFSDVDEFIFS